MGLNAKRFSVTTIVLFAALWAVAVPHADAGERGEAIHQALKAPFEERFGRLDSKIAYERKQPFGTVIAVQFVAPEGKLEDGWPAKAVAALAKVDVVAKESRTQVRAEKQSLAGHKFMSLQVTSSRGVDEHDSMTVVLLIGR